MSTADPARAGGRSEGYVGGTTRDYVGDTSGDGWVLFAGTMLLMVGTLNVIDGIPAYPLWSLALFTLDILVIYGLIAHGAPSSIV